MTNDEMHQAVCNKIAELYHIVKREMDFEMPDIDIRFNSRLKTTAGRAHYRRSMETVDGRAIIRRVPTLIDFHPGLAYQDWHEFINDTVPHEYAHAVDYAYFNNSGHGATWKHIMRLFGREPKRCHNLDTSKWRAKRPFIWKCNCDTPHYVTKQKHRTLARKVQMFGRSMHHCKRCKGTLVYSHQHGTKPPAEQPVASAARAPEQPSEKEVAPVQTQGMTKIGFVRQLVRTSSKSDAELVDMVVDKCNINRSRARRYIRKARAGK